MPGDALPGVSLWQLQPWWPQHRCCPGFTVFVFWEGQKYELMDLLLVCQGSWEATVLTRGILDAKAHPLRLVAMLKS